MKSILIIRLKKVIVTLESHALLVGSIYTTLIQTNNFPM